MNISEKRGENSKGGDGGDCFNQWSGLAIIY